MARIVNGFRFLIADYFKCLVKSINDVFTLNILRSKKTPGLLTSYIKTIFLKITQFLPYINLRIGDFEGILNVGGATVSLRTTEIGKVVCESKEHFCSMEPDVLLNHPRSWASICIIVNLASINFLINSSVSSISTLHAIGAGSNLKCASDPPVFKSAGLNFGGAGGFEYSSVEEFEPLMLTLV